MIIVIGSPVGVATAAKTKMPSTVQRRVFDSVSPLRTPTAFSNTTKTGSRKAIPNTRTSRITKLR